MTSAEQALRDVILEDVDEAEITARLKLIGEIELEGIAEWNAPNIVDFIRACLPFKSGR